MKKNILLLTLAFILTIPSVTYADEESVTYADEESVTYADNENTNILNSTVESSLQDNEDSNESSENNQYAQFFDVYFDTNSEETDMWRIEQQVARFIPEPEGITKKGYTLLGWELDGRTGIYWSFNEEIMPPRDIILHAKWKRIENVVTFDVNGGEPKITDALVGSGDLIFEPAVTKQGYVLDYWEKDGSKWDFNADPMPEEDITLKAIWKETDKETDIMFHPNDSSNDFTKHVKIGDKLEEPVMNKRKGYIFDGWYTDQKFTNKWNFETDIVENETLELFAKWDKDLPVDNSENIYLVSFNSLNDNPVVTQEIEENEYLIKPADPIKKDYIFTGWYKDKECKYRWVFDKDVITEDIELYAGWIHEDIKLYNVFFDSQGGTSIKPYHLPKGEKIIPLSHLPKKEHYIFKGWSLDQNGSDMFSFENAFMPKKDIILYAQWEEETKEIEDIDNTENNNNQSIEDLVEIPMVEDTKTESSTENYTSTNATTTDSIKNNIEKKNPKTGESLHTQRYYIIFFNFILIGICFLFKKITNRN